MSALRTGKPVLSSRNNYVVGNGEMINKSVYLVGPITGCTYDGCTNWRQYAVQKLNEAGISAFSPMRGKDYLLNEREVRDSYPDYVLSTVKGITTRDRFDCQRAGLIIANFLGATRVSIGSCIEFGWADAARVPVIMVIEEDGSNPHEHGMLREIAGFIVHSLDEAIQIASTILAVR